MKRNLRYWLLPVVCLSLLTGLFSPVYAQPQEGSGFTEDFESSPAQGWELSPDTTVEEGELRLYGGNFAMRLGEWGDQDTQIRFQFPAAEGELVIHYFANEQGGYNLIFAPDMVVLEKSAGADNSMILAEGPYQRTIDTWLDLTLKVDNGEHTLTLGGETILSATDPDPLKSGAFGFRYFGPDYLSIDSVSLSPLGVPEGQTPLQEEQPSTETQPTAVATETSSSNLFDSLQGLFDLGGTQIDLLTFVINLLLSVVLAYILGRVYIYWGGSLSNRRKFAANFMLMTVTTTFIILVVRSSVALSLGLVGALSIVRFRTAVKEPEELAYIFFAIGIGIGLGDNQRLITIVAFGVAILIVGLLKLFRHNSADVNLHLTVTSENPNKLTLEQIMDALAPHTAKLKLLRLDETDKTIETAFLVEFKHIEDLNAAKDAIQGLSPTAAITFLDNKGIW